jgi:esterase/lipase superfamily enzyme
VRELSGRHTVWASGCSMGAYHSANLFFRHPDMVDGLLAISGVYRPVRFVGSYTDDAVYFNSPLYYLPNLEDPWFLDRYRRARIVFCVGQGAWEDDMVADTRAMQEVLEAKAIPATFDYWGHDVNHDWPWWRQMLPHHVGRLLA